MPYKIECPLICQSKSCPTEYFCLPNFVLKPCPGELLNTFGCLVSAFALSFTQLSANRKKLKVEVVKSMCDTLGYT